MPLKSLLLTSALVAFTAAAPAARSIDESVAERTSWTIDGSRSDVRFVVTKFGFEDVTGIFHESEGTIEYDPDRPERSRIEWRVKVASVTTDATNRDKALQAPEYFDAARHPYLSFVSQSVRGLPGGRLEVSGQLTMRGVTRPLVTTVNVVTRGPAPAFETAFEVNRYDFGIAGGSVMGRLIGRTVRIRLVAAVVPDSTNSQGGAR
jgi:polyisoprenoid-binding protein YceI